MLALIVLVVLLLLVMVIPFVTQVAIWVIIGAAVAAIASFFLR